jgi:predicted amidophosphoribosyltransferase
VRQKLLQAARRRLEDVADTLWPGACRACGTALPADMVVPRAARRGATLYTGRLRRRVVGGLSLPLWLLCPACCVGLRPAPRLEPALAAGIDCVTAFAPEPVLFDLVHALKYEGVAELADWFGGFLARAARRRIGRDLVLVPVPLHPSRERRRGFNQSALLARAVAVRLGCAVAEAMLVRQRDTSPQARLAHPLRAANVRDAFARVAPRPPGAARVVLVDDVVTTGATAAAALAALGCAAAPVAVLALCRAKPSPAAAPAAPPDGGRGQILPGQDVEAEPRSMTPGRSLC